MGYVTGGAGGGGGGAPSGAAGGDLSGTYPNPAVAQVNGVSAASYALLAGPTFTGTVTLPVGTVTSGMILDGTIVTGDLSSTIALPSGATATTAAVDTNTTALATTAMVLGQAASATPGGPGTAAVGTSTRYARGDHVHGAPSFGHNLQIGPKTYATIDPRIAGSTFSAVATTNDSRFMRITIGETGTLHDLYVYVGTQGGNMKLGVYDCGNANATHTTSTQLSVSGAIDISAAGNSWKGYDPNISVTAGDTLNFHCAADGTTATFLVINNSNAAEMTLPTTSFYVPSGAGTMTPKICGLTASFYTTPPSTITDANHTTAAKSVVFVWRIA